MGCALGFRRAAAAAAAAAAEAVCCVLVCCVCPCLHLSLSVVFRLQDKLLRNLRTNNFRADDKKGYTPPNVGKKGDTAFHRPRGFRCTCGRWHQSNGPAGCMRFHGTLFFACSSSLYHNGLNGLWHEHSPLRNFKRTYG